MDSAAMATLVGAAIGALASAVIAAVQATQAKHTARAQFLLALDDAMQGHRGVHLKLRGAHAEWGAVANRGCTKDQARAYARGESVPGCAGPQTGEEWAAVEAYIGLFERIDFMIEKGVVDLAATRKFYGYRVGNIVTNPVIRTAKLVDEGGSWEDFLELCRRLDVAVEDAPRKQGGGAPPRRGLSRWIQGLTR